MKTLKEPYNNFVYTLSMQIPDPHTKYIQNPYVVKDGDAVFNCLTGEAVLMEGNESNLELIRRWFLIPEDISMRTLMYTLDQTRLREVSRPGSNLKTLYTIFTTTKCNASCSYCFERGCEQKDMNDGTARDVADYILRTHSKSNPITIKWFGGEPLLNKRPINIISKYLNENSVKFRSTITSNGYFFNDCTDEELKDIWHVRSVQFTVDDAGKGYESIKGLPSGAYEELRKTVERLEKLKIGVHLRLHFNPDVGIDACRRVVEDFKQYSNVSMYCKIVFQNDSKERYEELLELEKDLVSIGKKRYVFPNYGAGYHCMADNSSMVTITPDGKFTPCENFSDGENLYGSIYTREQDRTILRKWYMKTKYDDPACKTCPLYPNCRKLTMCPAEGKCSDGYQYYQIETIKRALRKKVEELNGGNN